MPPVDSAGFTHRVPTPLELLREARVGREPGWPREQLFVQRDELLWTHGRFGTDHRSSCATAVLVVIVCLRLLGFVVDRLEPLGDSALHRLYVFARQDSLAHEPLTPDL